MWLWKVEYQIIAQSVGLLETLLRQIVIDWCKLEKNARKFLLYHSLYTVIVSADCEESTLVKYFLEELYSKQGLIEGGLGAGAHLVAISHN